MIEIKLDLEIKYQEPDINEYFFKQRNPYYTYDSVEEFCNKRGFRYDKDERRITKIITNEIIKFDSLMDCFVNLETILKEDYDEKYSYGIYLKEIKYKIISISGVIKE